MLLRRRASSCLTILVEVALPMRRVNLLLRCLALGLVFGAIAPKTPALAQGIADTHLAAMMRGETSLLRRINFAEIGFRDGVEFTQLAGDREIFFPAPDTDALLAARLTLEIRHGATIPADRYIRVSLAGRIAGVYSLEGLQGSQSLTIDVPRSALRNGFLRVGLFYSGAATEQICVDERSSGDFVQIGANSAVTYDLRASALDTPLAVARIMPPELRIDLPGGPPDDATLAYVLQAGAIHGGASGRVAFVPRGDNNAHWRETDLQIVPGPTTSGARVSVVQSNGRPSIRFSGVNPQSGLRQLASRWAAFSDVPETATGMFDPTGPDNEDRISLAGFGAAFSPVQVMKDARVEVSFAAEDVPVQRRVAAVELLMTSGGGDMTAAVHLNGTLLGGLELSEDGPQRVSFDVPMGLVGRNNLLSVAFQRQIMAGNCRFSQRSYPAQLLAASHLVLQPQEDTPRDFHALAQAYRDSVELVVSADETLDRTQLPAWLATVGGAAIPARAEVILQDRLSNERPFLYVSNIPPNGAEARLRFDKGSIEIVDANDETIFRGTDLTHFGILQIVEVNGQRGLWLRPGNGSPPAPDETTPIILDRGDIAIFDERGIALVTSTERSDLLRIVYPENFDLLQTLEAYRPWLVGGGWLGMTALLLGFLQRRYRMRRSDGGADT